MSRSAKSVSTDRPFATVFYGGAARGKVIQFHMNPEDLDDTMLSLFVYDTNGGSVSTLGEWIASNNTNLGMVLFDPYAEPKVQSVPIQVR